MRTRSLFRSTPTKRRGGAGIRLTVPRGCMSIAEMLRRYVRREALPAERRGIYVDVGYDLEKVAGMDRVEQQDVLDQVREDVKVKKAAVEADIAREELRRAKASPAPKKKKVRPSDPKAGIKPSGSE